MGFFSTVRDNIINPIKSKASAFALGFQEFQNNHPRFKATWKFLTHITMIRIYAIVGGIIAAPFTGGFSLIVSVKIGVTFVTSLFSVVAKAIQTRNFRKLKLQRGLANAIVEKHAKTMSLEKNRERLFKVLGQNKEQQVHHVESRAPNRFVSFLKTIRDFGAENLAPGVMMFFTTGLPGAIGYMVALIGGAAFISGEFAERTKIEHNSTYIKDSIRGACKMANIPPYKNLTQLHGVFEKKMIEAAAMERMCKIFDDNPQMSDANIKRIYQDVEMEIASRIKFEGIPPDPNIFRSAWHNIRPWDEKPISEYVIPVDKLISYKEPEFVPKQQFQAQSEVTIEMPPLSKRPLQKKENKKVGKGGRL